MKRTVLIVSLLIGIFSPLPIFAEITLPAHCEIHADKAQMRILETALSMFQLHMGRYPTSEEGLRALIERPSSENAHRWQGPYLRIFAVPKDRWDHEFQYRMPGTHNEALPYDLYSLGQDGVSQTDGNDRDDLSDWNPCPYRKYSFWDQIERHIGLDRAIFFGVCCCFLMAEGLRFLLTSDKPRDENPAP